jgi:RNA polymerase sigma-70 factor (ECF subfamily)
VSDVSGTDDATIRDASADIALQRSTDEVVRELWEQNYGPLANWCAGVLGDRDDANDIASEAFTRLLTRWVSVRDPRGFLYVTATNLMRDRWRREQRHRRLKTRLEMVTPTSVLPFDPCMLDLIDRLPDKMRTPVLLHYYIGMSVAEVAAALHRPAGTIKRTLFDARRRLSCAIEHAGSVTVES